jgi:hypothetical protein
MGSGASGTICVCGQYFDGPALKRLLLALLTAIFKALRRFLRWLFGRKPSQATALTAPVIWVRVSAGALDPSPPCPSQAGDVQASVSGQSWCARNVPIPAGSKPGDRLTAYAWLNPVPMPSGCPADASSTFNYGGSGDPDCCSGCGSASPFPDTLLAGELASHPRLEVTVPDGPHAGLHRATAVSHLTWEMTTRGMTYKVSCDPPALVIRGPSSSAPAASVEGNPFSATFSGAVFGAAGDVVVTKA